MGGIYAVELAHKPQFKCICGANSQIHQTHQNTFSGSHHIRTIRNINIHVPTGIRLFVQKTVFYVANY